MTYKGLAKGKVIELEESLPYPDGSKIEVSVKPSPERVGSPATILRAMEQPPHPARADVDELERAIQNGTIPVNQNNPFDTH